MSDSPRRNQRVAAVRGLLVRCDSWSEFVQHYATDISQGGMFIVTDEPPELLSEIDVQMSLPEGHDVLMRAQVVHVIDAAQAERDGRPAGIGVQFLALDAMRKAQIRQLVEFARWEGATERPSASLASRMFEAATSLPPPRLKEALPAPAPVVPAGQASTRAPNERSAGSSAPGKPLTSRAPADRAAPASDRRRSVAAPSGGSNSAPPASAAPPGSSALPAPAPPAGKSAPPADASAAASSQAPSARSTGKPLDTERLKMGMTHLAHRRYMEAINLFSELSVESPQDPQPVMWRALTRARLKLKDNDASGAAEHYAQVLAIDENNHEARKFVREHGQKQRLQKLPFGRYFMKK